MTIHTPEEIRVALARRFRRASHIALPERTADDAMVIVREVLDERDRELAAACRGDRAAAVPARRAGGPGLRPPSPSLLTGTVQKQPPRRVGAESN